MTFLDTTGEGMITFRTRPPRFLNGKNYAGGCTLPTDFEDLRCKYAVLSNLSFVAEMRLPGRQMLADLDKSTFSEFLDKRLGLCFLTKK